MNMNGFEYSPDSINGSKETLESQTSIAKIPL